MSRVTLAPLTADDLPVVASYHGCNVDDLRPMLAESQAKCHDGRYYEQFAIRAEGRMIGLASLYAQCEAAASEGIEAFPPFRRCGFAKRALSLLEDAARRAGFAALTAQVRTDNAASLALHSACGFVRGEKWRNRKGNEVVTFRKEIKTCITK